MTSLLPEYKSGSRKVMYGSRMSRLRLVCCRWEVIVLESGWKTGGCG